MDGARYNRDDAVIDDQNPSELYSKMPLIWFKPTEDFKRNDEDYQCPCYKTGERKGMLNTTGQSTNFICYVDVPTNLQPSVWVRRAAAMLCALND
jgi:dynein heavy chain